MMQLICAQLTSAVKMGFAQFTVSKPLDAQSLLEGEALLLPYFVVIVGTRNSN